MDYCFICIVSIINCYVSILLIYDYFRRNFQPTYSSHCIYIGSAILIGVFIGFVNLLSYPLINFACWIIILTLDICSLFLTSGVEKNVYYLIYSF